MNAYLVIHDPSGIRGIAVAETGARARMMLFSSFQENYGRKASFQGIRSRLIEKNVADAATRGVMGIEYTKYRPPNMYYDRGARDGYWRDIPKYEDKEHAG